MPITTDHKWKHFKYGYELPESVRASQFDWIDDDESYGGFILYRKFWYHISEFMQVPADSDEMAGWHGYAPDSYFSAVMLEISDDGESYRVGTLIN